YTGGKYDTTDKLKYTIRGVDATYRAPSGLTLRAEYTDNPVDRNSYDGGNIKRHGVYGMVEVPFGPKWTGVGMYSALREKPAANVERVSRATLGAAYQLT